MEEVFDTAKRFIEQMKPGARVALVMDTDADGLAGARIIESVLEKRGIIPKLVFPGKGEWAYSPATVHEVKKINPDYIIAVDTGSAAQNPFKPVPTLVIDHHYPLGGEPEEGVIFCSAYGRQPAETASLMAYLIGRELSVLTELEWVGLLLVIGYLGAVKDFDYLKPLARKYATTQLRKAVSLINACRRSSACDARTAYAVIKEVRSPQQIIEGNSPNIKKLHKYKAEVQAELTKAQRTRPYFAGENVLVTVDSPCLVHGIIASIWANRLPEYRVLSANRGYLPGEIVFNFRTRRQDNLIKYLQDLLANEHIEGAYGYGHNQATGGRMSPASFVRLLERMGFDRKIIASVQQPILPAKKTELE
ncbi:MAG: hypothetical protein N2246_00360 [Candidatus Sumerlaeia bacterium]|nr:hypothetical protein [Candidatus Sumerlaeia bacterium]